MSSSPEFRSVDEGLRLRLITALENPEYDWRTVAGVASELGVPESDVIDAFGAMPETIVRASDGTGRSIFTTRKHYDDTHGVGDKLLSALIDKVVA